jgi:hypothetical protein
MIMCGRSTDVGRPSMCINAKAETVASRRLAAAFGSGRCVVTGRTKIGARSEDEKQSGVIVDHLAGNAQYEVRGNNSPCWRPSPSSTRHVTKPCCRAGSGLLPRKPCPTMLNRSERFGSPKRIVPASVKDVSRERYFRLERCSCVLCWQQHACRFSPSRNISARIELPLVAPALRSGSSSPGVRATAESRL